MKPPFLGKVKAKDRAVSLARKKAAGIAKVTAELLKASDTIVNRVLGQLWVIQRRGGTG